MIVWDLTCSTACQSLIFEFPSRKAITRVHTSPSVDISRDSNGHISVVRDATVRWLGMQVVLHVLCMLMWPWPDPRSRSQSFQSCENCSFPGLSPPPFSSGAQNWWLMVIVCDLIYSLSKSDFRISFWESYHESSNFAECRYFTKFKWPYFGSAWRYSQMVEHAGSPTGSVHDLDPIQGQGQGHGASAVPKITENCTAFYLHAACGWNLVVAIAGRPQQPVHTGGDDHQPPCGAFWLCLFCVVVHFFWLVNVCLCCVRFSFSIPSQEIALGNVSEMIYMCRLELKP